VTTSTKDATPIQERIIRENFERSGPFFLGRDLHAMLDCACAPDRIVAMASGAKQGIDLVTPLSIQFNAKLREEFFGGILFDQDKHRHYMLDHTGYAMAKSLMDRGRSQHELLDMATPALGAVQPEEAYKALLQQGIIGPAGKPSTIQHFAARDLSLAYLQSPIIVEIEVTYGCFRACKHCAYESSPEARMPDELSAEQWQTIFVKLAQAGVLIAQLTGGDPLYRDDSFDIIDAASEAGLSVYVRSDTAALSRKKVQRLKAVPGLWHIGTSIDGADAEMHDWMRGRGAFDALRERVGILAAEGIDVAAGATLHKNNYRTVREIGQRVTELGARWFDIGFLSPVGRGLNLRHLVLDEGEIEESLAFYLDGVRVGDYVPSHAHYVRRAASSMPFTDLIDLIGKLPYVTEWPFSRLRLDPTGSSYTAGKLKGSDYAGGYNLLNASVEHVWDNSPNLQQLRELGNGGRIHSLDYRLLRSNHEFMQ
jgi:MoaA/NifB/PqqE/SkfB family radical SAM enzyme